MRIGMFGLRGLRPDREISGFETAFAEIAPRLASRGHEVTIYCRSAAYSPDRRVDRDDGVELLYMPSPGGKNFAAVTSTLLAVLHALATRRFDVMFFVNVGMGYHCALARVSGAPVVLNVDGLDWQRAKWGPVARAYLYSAARVAVLACTRLVTDAEAMRAYYRERFGSDSTMIAYGADVEGSTEPRLLERCGVHPRDYYLVVSRFVPENTLDVMLDGFRRSRTCRRLVVVGSSTYNDSFHDRLRAIAASDDRIHLVGQIADQQLLKELWCNCHAYLHGHSVGGTNPALLRAMGHGSCVLALDTVFNREVLAGAGAFFSRDAAAVAELVNAIDSDARAVERLRRAAAERIRAHYSWERVTDEYERLFESVSLREPTIRSTSAPDASERAQRLATRP